MPPQQLLTSSATDYCDRPLQRESNAGEDLTLTANKYFSAKWFSDWEGYGCIALKDIEKHTLIHVEAPFLKGPQISQAIEPHSSSQHTPHLDDVEYLKNVCGKSNQEIANLWQLHDQYNTPNKRLRGILLSNSFENHEKGYQKRLYLTTSRFNHGCSPNCGYDFDDWNIRIYSLRKIKAGETLCISYSDVIYFFPRDVRRSYLLGALKFDCACTRCNVADNDSVVTISDENRRRLKKIAIELKYRTNATLYDAEFCLQVNETASRISTKKLGTVEASDGNKQLLLLKERARLRRLSKTIPIGQHDIDLIVEYITIAEKEKVDFDMLPLYRLAYDVTLKIGGQSDPSKEYWADRYLELSRCAKGPDHPETLKFIEECQLAHED